MLTTLGILNQVSTPYATWSDTNKSDKVTLSNNNLTFRGSTGGAAGKGTCIATIGKSSGKWYWEITINSANATALGGLVGACSWIPTPSNRTNAWESLQGAGIINNGTVPCLGLWISGGSSTTSGSCITTLVTNDVISVALDMDAKTLKFYKNGVQYGTTITGLTGTWYPACMSQGTEVTRGGTANFGQNPWSATTFSLRNSVLIPAGFNMGVFS